MFCSPKDQKLTESVIQTLLVCYTIKGALYHIMNQKKLINSFLLLSTVRHFKMLQIFLFKLLHKTVLFFVFFFPALPPFHQASSFGDVVKCLALKTINAPNSLFMKYKKQKKLISELF